MEWFGLTDKGRVRPTNQDIYQIEAREENRTALLVVCDGMGGANAGNVASRFAAQVFTESIKAELTSKLDAKKRQDLLTRALDEANETVFSLAGRQPEFRGMGTTLVAALVQGDQATILNVGDSRAYLFDGTRLHQLTEDHSYVEEMRRQGRITEAVIGNCTGGDKKELCQLPLSKATVLTELRQNFSELRHLAPQNFSLLLIIYFLKFILQK